MNTGRINPTALRILFAILLLYVAGRVLFRPGGRARAGLETALLIAVYVLGYWIMRLFGRTIRHHPRWSIIYHSRRREIIEHDYEI